MVRIEMPIGFLLCFKSVGADAPEQEVIRMGHHKDALLPGWIALVVFDVLVYLLHRFVQLLLHIGTAGDINYCLGESGGNSGIGGSDWARFRYTHLELLYEHIERAIRRIQPGLGDN